ncbi:MAG: CoA-binding protein [Dehalococcoidia bacterium]|nr:CoA-binding protein [Dehalococcoidia bacterium]
MATDLDQLFNPRSIAIIGISTNPKKFGGNTWTGTLQTLGFGGNLYPVHPTLTEFNGLKVFRNIRDIPENVDLAIVTVPAQSSPQIMEDCVASGVKYVHFYTAGFGETGEKEGAVIEANVREIARNGNTRVIGPNCMGIYCPANGISWRPDFPREAGALSVFSQSGMNSLEIVKTGSTRGVYINKLVSYGNACDLNEIDFLEYFAADTQTKVIGAYIEGVDDGAGFLAVLKKATQAKPVIVLKGGATEAGTRATFSHTAAIAGAARIWDSAMEQTGATSVRDFEEFMDTVLTFLYLSPPQGENVAIIGSGGGCSVLATDACEKAGLKVPEMPANIQRELGKWMGSAGTSVRNPIDIPFDLSLQGLREVIRISASCSEISALIMHQQIDATFPFGKGRDPERKDQVIIESAQECGKPVLVILHEIGVPAWTQITLREQTKFHAAGIPTYRTVNRAAQAIRKLRQYHRMPPSTKD